MALRVERLVLGPVQTNAYVLICERSHEAILIDAVDEAPRLLELIKRQNATLKLIILTHAHFDHVLAAAEMQQASGAAVVMHADDQLLLDAVPGQVALFLGQARVPAMPRIDRYLNDHEQLQVGDIKLTVIHTPGHSPGSVSLYDGESQVWCGDALFAGSIGRTDLPGGDFGQLAQAIRSRLFSLPEQTLVWPGHGPETTIGHERQHNPFVGDRAAALFDLE